jgi:hypothetical protein
MVRSDGAGLPEIGAADGPLYSAGAAPPTQL